MAKIFMTKFCREKMCGHHIQGLGFNKGKVAETCVDYFFIDLLQHIRNTCHLSMFEVHWNVQCLVLYV